jgi:elongator complex protein 4
MSSFKRNAKKADELIHRSIPGVKPWLNCGLGIISSGNRELDDLIGGGVPLGTITFIATDVISNYGQTFLSYFIAEGISVGHSVLVLTFEDTNLEKLMTNLPSNQHMSSSSTSTSTTTSKRTEEEKASLDELKLAASYKKYIGNNLLW